MPQFNYKATSIGGKVVTGTIEAADEKAVVANLRQQSLIPIRITPLSGTVGKLAHAGSAKAMHWFNRASSRDILQFTQELGALLGAGLPMDKALTVMLSTAGKPALKAVIKDILNEVQGGSYLSDALARHPRVFSRFYASMVRAGESGGVLEPVLDRMGTFLEASQDLKDYIRSAMIYPLFLVGVGGLSIIILVTFVLPKFATIFADMGQAIPLTARLLLDFSDFLREYYLVIIPALGAAIFLLHRYGRSTSGQYALDRIRLRLPVIGDLVRNLETARFARTLGTMIKSGVPILQALSLVKQVVGNRVIADSLTRVYDRVKEGEKLSVPLENARTLPVLAVQMITVGEETGKLDAMLLKVGETYEKSLRGMVKKLVGLLEPAMILALGVVIGFIVITMLTAIFSMNEIPF